MSWDFIKLSIKFSDDPFFKLFMNIIRFRYALSKIRSNVQQSSLLDLAFECGYYEHAHAFPIDLLTPGRFTFGKRFLGFLTKNV